MSAFLAPIHTWVYNKIKLHEELENNLIEVFKRVYGDEIAAIVEVSRSLYGEPLPNRPVEEVVDLSNIHGWLQGRISIAETRLAAFLTEVFSRHPEAVETALKIYHEDGSDRGIDAKHKLPVDSAPELYKALNNYLLEGMPCDIVNIVVVNEDNRVVWENSRCLHRQYFEAVKGDLDVLYNLRKTWIKAFIESANSSFTYRVSPGENVAFIHEIITK